MIKFDCLSDQNRYSHALAKSKNGRKKLPVFYSKTEISPDFLLL